MHWLNLLYYNTVDPVSLARGETKCSSPLRDYPLFSVGADNKLDEPNNAQKRKRERVSSVNY
jgi:hypothetical protein